MTRYRLAWELTQRYAVTLTDEQIREDFGMSPQELAARVGRDDQEPLLSALGEFEHDELVREDWRVLRAVEAD